MTNFSRRNFAQSAALWAGANALMLTGARRASAAPTFLDDPFKLGVASGDPVPDGFVIWTRLAPDPFDKNALPPEAIPVTWEVGSDDKLQKIVARGQVYAEPGLAHSVHVDVRGLEHGRLYFYRFRCGAAVSRTGRAKTLTTPRLPLARLKFAYASCQHYEQGYFTAYRDMIAQDPDFILHLGDYVYESSWGTIVRHGASMDSRDLADYRLLHAVYKTDPDLQNAHAHCPWYVMWDDHEVANDYSLNQSERDPDPDVFHARRRVAYQAYYEHMPLRPAAAPDANGNMTLYQRQNFGDLMELAIIDQRQYRDAIPCQLADRHGGRVVDVTQCADMNDPARSMLGKNQERWLGSNWAKSGARWNVLGQTLMLAPFDQLAGPARGVYTDNWGGYPAARRKILDHIKNRMEEGAGNFVCLGGDIHSYFVSDIKEDELNPASRTLMSEFVTTSITSESYNTKVFQEVLPDNPHIKFIDDTVRGYVMCEVTPETWHTTLRVVENVRVRAPVFRTRASFVLENGNAGVQNA